MTLCVDEINSSHDLHGNEILSSCPYSELNAYTQIIHMLHTMLSLDDDVH